MTEYEQAILKLAKLNRQLRELDSGEPQRKVDRLVRKIEEARKEVDRLNPEPDHTWDE